MNDMGIKDKNIKTIIWNAKKKPKRMPSIFLAAERLQGRLAAQKKEKDSFVKKNKDGKSENNFPTHAMTSDTADGPDKVQESREKETRNKSIKNTRKEPIPKEVGAFCDSDLKKDGKKEGGTGVGPEADQREATAELNQTDDIKNILSGDPKNETENSNSRKPPREGWVSPDYNKSKTVKINYRIAARNRCVGFFRDLPYVEHYKMLRTQIQQRCGEKGWKTIMVTSVNSEEGKTVTAINLSVVLAREFEQTVLLVDADLQKQHVHKYMGYDASYSLVDYLERDVSLSDVIVWPGIEKLTVISGENTVRDSTEILGSPRMSSLVAEMKARYEKRYIVFDVPPVIGHADAMTFAPLMDGILLVVKPGRTDLKDVVKTMELLPKEKIIGFAMNRYE